MGPVLVKQCRIRVPADSTNAYFLSCSKKPRRWGKPTPKARQGIAFSDAAVGTHLRFTQKKRKAGADSGEGVHMPKRLVPRRPFRVPS